MIYTLKNQHLSIRISDRGAELQSILSQDGCEYLWQGDPTHWEDRAPWLFPICGRLANGAYTYRGKRFTMPIHGFVRDQSFSCLHASPQELTLSCTASPETKAQYPFDFVFSITYRLQESSLLISVCIENKGNEILPFALGAHPGFCVPICKNGDFSDCYLEFDTYCCPDRILFAENALLNGKREAYPLHNGRILPLSRALFDNAGIFLSNTSKVLALCSHKDRHSVRLHFDGFSYLGIWSYATEGADFLCIEPWNGLPSFDGDTEDLEQKSEMYRLLPNTKKAWSLRYDFS